MNQSGESIREGFRSNLFPTIAGRVGALPNVGGIQPLQVDRSHSPDFLDERIRPNINIRPPDAFRSAESGENILRHSVMIPSSPVDDPDDNLAINHSIRALLIHCPEEVLAKRGLGKESGSHSGRNLLHASFSVRVAAHSFTRKSTG
jgi:hypothetical protein